MSIGTILLIVLILLLVGALPTWPHSKNWLVLEQGVLEGRRAFGNIVKYLKMAAGSNFGNMFSVVGASAFLPFLFNCQNNPTLFQTGWFVESLFSQTLIIHVIRNNKIPFFQSRASWPLFGTSLIILVVGAWLTVSPLANTLGFVPLPPL